MYLICAQLIRSLFHHHYIGPGIAGPILVVLITLHLAIVENIIVTEVVQFSTLCLLNKDCLT